MRIQGVTIPDNKRLEVALTSIYGVGRVRARTILDEFSLGYDVKAMELDENTEKKIRERIEEFTIEGDLKREKQGNIQRLKDIQSYRGKRHSTNNPVRGQRTKTNKRTAMGNSRSTMGSGRRKVEKK